MEPPITNRVGQNAGKRVCENSRSRGPQAHKTIGCFSAGNRRITPQAYQLANFLLRTPGTSELVYRHYSKMEISDDDIHTDAIDTPI